MRCLLIKLPARIACSLTLVVSLFFAGNCSADFVMNVYPSSAPNVFGAFSSWPGYLFNAMIAIEDELGDIGDRLTDNTQERIAGSFTGQEDKSSRDRKAVAEQGLVRAGLLGRE